MAFLDNQPVDTDSSKASSITSRFHGSMNVQHGTGMSATVTLHQFIFFVFEIGL